MIHNWDSALIAVDATIRDALTRMGKPRILLVATAERVLLGTITDGDIRRALLRGDGMDTPVSRVMNRNPRWVHDGTSPDTALRMMTKLEIQYLPVVEGGIVVGLIGLADLVEVSQDRPNWTLILAGGQGRRLRPLTETMPKPMLPLGGRPILETIVRELEAAGLRRIFLSINYKAEIIKAHFGDGSAFGVEIRYIEEDQPLGTAGPLGLIPRSLSDPVLVMNGDVLTKTDFGQLIQYHEAHSAKATIGVRMFDMQVPYGVLEFNGKRISAIVEKPMHQFKVSAGIYVVEPSVCGLVTGPQDMPDLLRALIDDEQPVVGFPIHEYWIDVGSLPDLAKAEGDYADLFLAG